MDIFDTVAVEKKKNSAPLAARMRLPLLMNLSAKKK